MNVKNYHTLSRQLKEGITLVAVSKNKSPEDILTLYAEGQRVFGENYVQELLEKAPKLPKDIQWHFIGHLQTNKVKQIIRVVHCIESADRTKIIDEINHQSDLSQLHTTILLQYRLAEEETKYGMNDETLSGIISRYNAGEWQNITIGGMMAMGSLTDNKQKTREEFIRMKKIFDRTREQITFHPEAFVTLSMGMSSDYTIAMEEGSTSLRIGSLLFGQRA